MKISITKEKNNLFFAKLIGVEGVYAQGETMQKTIHNLLDVYIQVISFKQHIADKTPAIRNLYKQSKTLSELSFSRLEFSL